MTRDMEERREQILQAALRVFSQKGFSKATNKDIAQEAEIAPSLIYYYFKSKEELLRAVIENFDPIFRVMTPHTLQDTASRPEVFLKNLIQQLLSGAENEPFVGLTRVALSEVLHGDAPYVLAFVPEAFDRGLHFIDDYLQAKMASGELRHADSLPYAQMIVSSLTSFVLRRLILKDPFALQYSQEQIADMIVETILGQLVVH